MVKLNNTKEIRILNGNEIISDEFEVLKSLEALLTDKIPSGILNYLEGYGFNYKVKNQHVVELTIKLREVELNSKVKAVLYAGLKTFKFLELLHLEGIGLKEVPEPIKKLKFLKSLILFDNNIKYLPPWLSDLKLKNLTLSHNEELANLDNMRFNTSIEKLYLKRTGLHSAPKNIEELKSLEYLS
ncbi:MAG: hypothetical protein ACTSVE_08950, partial [Candidatus Helarchaeota archaeon]